MFIDSHCHLDRLDLSKHNDSLTELLNDARQRGVSKMLCVGIDMNLYPAMLEAIEGQPDVFASVGIHPCHVEESPWNESQIRQAVADNQRVVALGETGLDFFYKTDTKEQQVESFANHLKLGSELDLPVIIHTREAREETLEVMQEHADPNTAGVMHCFTETMEMAMRSIELGFMISFSGIITFKNAQELREVVKAVPLDKFLIETDSPYLAPVPFRGKPNQPGYVAEVAQCIADLKGLRVEEVAEISAANFHRLFKKAA